MLEAVSGTCTLYLCGRAHLLQLALDACVLYGVVVLHAVVIMCQALVFSVAMNSKKNALLALLIAANFVEIKVSEAGQGRAGQSMLDRGRVGWSCRRAGLAAACSC